MEADFGNIAGMFKMNIDVMNKTIEQVSPESWFSSLATNQIMSCGCSDILPGAEPTS